MSFKRKLKNFVLNTYDKYTISLGRKNEIEKYNAQERIDIYSKIDLSAEQKKAIDDLYFNNYGEKIPYVWHQNFMAHSGDFDEKYFPELLYIPEFERYMNLWPEYVEAFSDKNVISLIAANAEVNIPKAIISVAKGLPRDGKNKRLTKSEAIDLLSNIGKVFIKPTVDSCSGNGCFIADFNNGSEAISGKTAYEIYNALGDDFVVQEVVRCHKSISRIYDKSANTFRIITYRWKDEICCAPITMRIGQGGSYLDNAHAGGMFIAIDGDGTMHKTAMTEFNEKYTAHPDTGFVFEGEKIELVPMLIESAKRMHTLMPQIGVANWDFTIDENSDPILIEANLKGGGIWLPQMAHGCGAFGENTVEILRWMKKIKSTPRSERFRFAFGNM